MCVIGIKTVADIWECLAGAGRPLPTRPECRDHDSTTPADLDKCVSAVAMSKHMSSTAPSGDSRLSTVT